MNEENAPVPEVPKESFRQAYHVAEEGVLRHPESAIDLGETLRPTLKIARTIARGVTVGADELYAMSVRVCALWRLLASEPAQLRGFGIAFTEEGIRCTDAQRNALLDIAAAAPLSDDLRFETDSFVSTLKSRVA
jgi:hypothetical protein